MSSSGYRKYDICVNTIVRDGADTIYPVVEAVKPYAKRVIVTVDSRTRDNTREVLSRIDGIEMREFEVKRNEDIVAMRNSQLGFEEKWGWIVDADEYYPKINLKLYNDSRLRLVAPWDREHAHRATSRAKPGRIFRNKGKLKWKGPWGREILTRSGRIVFDSYTPILVTRYIHLTHLKKLDWRGEERKRNANEQFLIKMSEYDIKNLNKFYEKMQDLREG